MIVQATVGFERRPHDLFPFSSIYVVKENERDGAVLPPSFHRLSLSRTTFLSPGLSPCSTCLCQRAERCSFNISDELLLSVRLLCPSRGPFTSPQEIVRRPL